MGRKLLTAQVQLAGVISALNLGQLNQAAVQQLAQAGLFGSANNVAVVSQGNAAGAASVLMYCYDSWRSSATEVLEYLCMQFNSNCAGRLAD